MRDISFDKMYREIPLSGIPWNRETPPSALIELVENETVRPCRTIDLGCGAGNYAIYLASRGFEVTGVDSSPAAIGIAQENARKRGIACRFVASDLLGDLPEVQETFGFAYDWSLLHHIYPEDRENYIKNVRRLLDPGALYLSVAFSETHARFGGSAKYRTTPNGSILYFSSEAEMRDLLSPHFIIRDLRTIEIIGKLGLHRAVYVLSERR
jgi:SAM-dependent methyltransferase